MKRYYLLYLALTLVFAAVFAWWENAWTKPLMIIGALLSGAMVAALVGVVLNSILRFYTGHQEGKRDQ